MRTAPRIHCEPPASGVSIGPCIVCDVADTVPCRAAVRRTARISGDPFGICAVNCTHNECLGLFRTMQKVCPGCEQVIGEGRLIVYVSGVRGIRSPRHVECTNIIMQQQGVTS